MTTNTQKTLVALAVGAMFTASGAAMATNLTWDSSTTSPTAPVDGAGTWNTTAANWSNGTTDAAWNNTSDSSYTAVFGASNGTAGTVTLGANIMAGGLTFNPATSSNYTIAGSSSYGLTLTGASVVANTGATISANTDFTAGLNLTGNSQLTLNGVNTNTVGTTIGAGSTLATRVASDPTVSGVQQISDPFGTGTITVDNGGQLRLGLNNNGEGNQTATLNNNLVLSGTAYNGGALFLQNNIETFNLDGTVAISGGTQVFNFGIDTNVNFNNVISGSGGLILFGQSATNNELQSYTLNSAETYTGNTTFSTFAADTLVALKSGTNTLPTGTTLNLNSSSFGTVGVSGQGPSTLTLDLAGNNQAVAGLNVGSLNSGGVVTIEDSTGNGATLTVGSAGAGSFSLNSETININTNINATGAANFASASAGSVVNVNATFNTPFYFDVGNGNGATTININNGGTITNTGEYLFTYGGGAGSTMNVNTGGTMDAFQIRLGNSANAILNLNGGLINTDLIHTVYSGGGTLNLNGGTLEASGVGGGGAIQNPWLESSAADPLTVNVLNGGVTIEVPTNYNANVTAALLQGPSASTGGVSITGGGTLTLLGTTNTYTGPTSINTGTLVLAMSGTTAATIADSSLLTVHTGGTFDISAITATPTTLNGLAAEGGTFFFGMNGNQVSSILVNNAASVTGTNTISLGISSLGTTGPAGVYTLIGDSSGGLLGTFQFANGTDTANATLGGTSYTFTLTNSNTAEILNVSAVPEPATLGLLAIGGLALLMVKRKRKAQV